MTEPSHPPDIAHMAPLEAWAFLKQHRAAVLLDVRSRIEYSHVGHPVGALNIPWKEAPEWTINPDFVADVEAHVPDRETPVLLLCRSGQRSLAAAQALAAAGYRNAINIDEGFEGPLDEKKHRGSRGGWRYHGLPWEQT